jgi:hypothetical protein
VKAVFPERKNGIKMKSLTRREEETPYFLRGREAGLNSISFRQTNVPERLMTVK